MKELVIITYAKDVMYDSTSSSSFSKNVESPSSTETPIPTEIEKTAASEVTAAFTEEQRKTVAKAAPTMEAKDVSKEVKTPSTLKKDTAVVEKKVTPKKDAPVHIWWEVVLG